MDQIHTHMRPLLMMLGDYRSLTLNVVNRLTSVTRLFPNSFNDKFCDQMMVSPSLFSSPGTSPVQQESFVIDPSLDLLLYSVISPQQVTTVQ